jgi:copper(I)-binding protein
MDAGIARMRPVEALEVAPGTPTVLAPGGLHIMLMGVERKLIEGQTLPLELTFETAGTVALEVPIRGLAAGMKPGMDHGQHGHGEPGKMMTD